MSNVIFDLSQFVCVRACAPHSCILIMLIQCNNDTNICALRNVSDHN